MRSCDNAGGIAKEIMDKMFDPYFTTKGPGKGTGIGFFMSKTIIEKNMGGRLLARNTRSSAEFSIEVCLHDKPACPKLRPGKPLIPFKLPGA
jgi:C4-dicarboxylate-specific signal transduction histidine kinase